MEKRYRVVGKLFDTLSDFLGALIVVSFETHDRVISVELEQIGSLLLKSGVIGFDEFSG